MRWILRGNASLAVICVLAACSGPAIPHFPWPDPIPATRPYQILSTDHPISEPIDTYVAWIRTDKGASRDEIKLISEKVIEGLPKHNMAILSFITDPGEKDKGQGWTVARTFWGFDPVMHPDMLEPSPGDYRYNVMKIAVAGEELPGVTITIY